MKDGTYSRTAPRYPSNFPSGAPCSLVSGKIKVLKCKQSKRSPTLWRYTNRLSPKPDLVYLRKDSVRNQLNVIIFSFTKIFLYFTPSLWLFFLSKWNHWLLWKKKKFFLGKTLFVVYTTHKSIWHRIFNLIDT